MHSENVQPLRNFRYRPFARHTFNVFLSFRWLLQRANRLYFSIVGEYLCSISTKNLQALD